ncbi:MAG: ribosome maturation factor [Treponema sp.]|nr:ribosome maturation factor [Treponema sp.]MCR5622327.1 ribosome maturation factor [Treponema sp.]
MEYIPYEGIPYFKDCEAVVKGVGLLLVELQVVPQRGNVHVCAVIARSDGADVSVSDCSKVHHALGPAVLSFLQKERDDITEDNVSMEVCSPGTERNVKNAAEFAVFKGREIRVWDKTVGDWVRGTIVSSSEDAVTLNGESGEISVRYVDIAKAKFIHN